MKFILVFDNLKRINTIFIDMNKAICNNISMNYMTQKFKNEVNIYINTS